MKRLLAVAVLFAVLFTLGAWSMGDHTARAADTQPAKKVLRHVVCFKFKKSSTPEEIHEIEQAFAALPSKIDAIKGFEWGTDVSVEQKAHGFTHCFVVTFADKAGRDRYLPHPAHQAFGKLVGPHLEDVFVIDYWGG